MTEILRVQGLVKHFGAVQAVNGVDFGITSGHCFGLLGPNGAGKTTIIEMMEGILAPTTGVVLFHGQPIDRHFKQKVGIQFQSTALPEYITVQETLELFSSFYPHPRPLAEVIELCSLSDILTRDNQKLSGGQRQRMFLGMAIIPRPEIVFLDEPTTGLDPQARRNFWDLIRRIKSEGATILLTTHYMEEAELLCDQVAIMDHGRILELDSPAHLLAKHFHGALLRLPVAGGQVDAMRAAVGRVAGASCSEQGLEISTNNLDGTMKELLRTGIDLTGLSIHKPNLEDLFIKLTGSTLRA